MTGWIPITGSQLCDSSGVLVSNATITWAPVDGNGNPTSFRTGGQNGQVVRTPVTAPVINGAFAITLPDVSLCNPVNVGFSVTVTDLETGDVILGPAGYSCVQPSSAAYAASWCNASGGNFDLYTPNLPAVPITTIAGGSLTGLGPPGQPGQPGQNGLSATVSAGTATALPSGSAPTVTNSGTSSAAVFNFGIPAGAPGQNGTNGQNGTAATIAVGGVTALPSSAAPTVSNSGSSSAAVLQFGIPAGPTGLTGAAATVGVGTVTTLPAGEPGTVTNSGTSAGAVLNFGLPLTSISIGQTITLPAGSAATVSFSPGSDALHLVLNFGIPGGALSVTSSTVGLALIDSYNNKNYQVFSSNKVVAEALMTSSYAGPAAVASVLLKDTVSGYYLLTSADGDLILTPTGSTSGAVSSVTIPDTVGSSVTRSLTSTNGVLVAT